MAENTKERAKTLILSTLSNKAYLSINKKLIHSIGLKETILLTDLISKYEYFKEKGKLTDEEWFFNTMQDIYENTGLSEYEQRKSIDNLISLELIETKIIGIPAKKYFRLRYEKIQNQVMKKLHIKELKNSKPIYNNNKINNNKVNKDSFNKLKDKESFQDSNKSFDNQEKQTFDKEFGLPDKSDKQSKKKKEYNIAINRINGNSIKLINIWNDFEQTTFHNNQKPYTKTFYNMVMNLSKLQQGTFAKAKTFDPKWIKNNNIPEKYFKKAWSFQELKEAITNLSKYSMEGYWPQTDKKFFKNLPNLIYNPIQKNSWLLNAIKNPPKQLEQINNEKPFENKYPKTTEIIKQSRIWAHDYEIDERKLEKYISKLHIFADNIINDKNDNNNHATYFFGDLQKIIKEYLNWLYEDAQDWVTKEINILSIDNKIFTKFIEDQEKELKIIINSKGWERK